MKCRRCRKLFIPCLEGALPEELSRRVEEHLSICPACAGEFEDIKEVSAALAGADCPAMDPLPDIRDRVMARIYQQPKMRNWRKALPAYSAAAAAMLLFAVILTTVNFQEPQQLCQAPQKRAALEKASEQPSHPAKKPVPAGAKQADAEAPSLPAELNLKSLPALPKSIKGAVASLPAQKPSEPELASAKIAEQAEAVRLQQYTQVPPGTGQQMPAAAPAIAQDAYAECGNSSIAKEPAAPSFRGASKASAAKMKRGSDLPASRAELLNLINTCRDAGRKEDEYAAAERLTSLFPDEAAYWFARGQAAEKIDKKQDAVDSYRRAVELKLLQPDLDAAKARLIELGRQ